MSDRDFHQDAVDRAEVRTALALAAEYEPALVLLGLSGVADCIRRLVAVIEGERAVVAWARVP